MRGAAEFPVARHRQVDATEMPVAVEAQVTHIVVVAAAVADLRRDDQEAIAVVMDRVGFVIDVEDVGDLRGEAGNREILPIEIGDEDIVSSISSLGTYILSFLSLTDRRHCIR